MSIRQTNEERLAVVETKLDTVIEQQKLTNSKLDVILPTLATTEALATLKGETEAKIRDIHAKRWVQNTLSAILGSILTFLIVRFVSTL